MTILPKVYRASAMQLQYILFFYLVAWLDFTEELDVTIQTLPSYFYTLPQQQE